MSLLTITQGAWRNLFPGTTVPSSVYANTTDANVVELLRLCNEGGKALMKRYPWAALITEKTFTTVAAAAQTSSVATDFDRILPETMFNRTTRRRVYGPVDPETWQNIQASLVTFVNPAFRIRGSGTASLLLTPTPSAGQTVAYEYITKNWCQSSGSVGQTEWAADTDTSLLDEHLHELDLVWRFRAAKGFDYTQELQNFETYLAVAMMNDGAKPRLSLDGTMVGRDRVPTAPQVPDTLVFT
jgi:hypothetical protein